MWKECCPHMLYNLPENQEISNRSNNQTKKKHLTSNFGWDMKFSQQWKLRMWCAEICALKWWPPLHSNSASLHHQAKTAAICSSQAYPGLHHAVTAHRTDVWVFNTMKISHLIDLRSWKRKLHNKPSPAWCAEVMSEEVIGSKFDGFFWSDQHNVDSGTYK